jgi:hypothetical protein
MSHNKKAGGLPASTRCSLEPEDNTEPPVATKGKAWTIKEQKPVSVETRQLESKLPDAAGCDGLPLTGGAVVKKTQKRQETGKQKRSKAYKDDVMHFETAEQQAKFMADFRAEQELLVKSGKYERMNSTDADLQPTATFYTQKNSRFEVPQPILEMKKWTNMIEATNLVCDDLIGEIEIDFNTRTFLRHDYDTGAMDGVFLLAVTKKTTTIVDAVFSSSLNPTGQFMSVEILPNGVDYFTSVHDVKEAAYLTFQQSCNKLSFQLIGGDKFKETSRAVDTKTLDRTEDLKTSIVKSIINQSAPQVIYNPSAGEPMPEIILKQQKIDVIFNQKISTKPISPFTEEEFDIHVTKDEIQSVPLLFDLPIVSRGIHNSRFKGRQASVESQQPFELFEQQATRIASIEPLEPEPLDEIETLTEEAECGLRSFDLNNREQKYCADRVMLDQAERCGERSERALDWDNRVARHNIRMANFRDIHHDLKYTHRPQFNAHVRRNGATYYDKPSQEFLLEQEKISAANFDSDQIRVPIEQQSQSKFTPLQQQLLEQSESLYFTATDDHPEQYFAREGNSWRYRSWAERAGITVKNTMNSAKEQLRKLTNSLVRKPITTDSSGNPPKPSTPGPNSHFDGSYIKTHPDTWVVDEHNVSILTQVNYATHMLMEFTNADFDKWHMVSRHKISTFCQDLQDTLIPDDVIQLLESNHVTRSMLTRLFQKKVRLCIEGGAPPAAFNSDPANHLTIIFHTILPVMDLGVLCQALETVFPSYFEARHITVVFHEPPEMLRSPMRIREFDQIQVYYEAKGVVMDATGSNVIRLTELLHSHETVPAQLVKITDIIDPKRGVRLGRIFPDPQSMSPVVFARQQIKTGLYIDYRHQTLQVNYFQNDLYINLTAGEVDPHQGFIDSVRDAISPNRPRMLCEFPDVRVSTVCDLAISGINTNAQLPAHFLDRPILTLLRGTNDKTGMSDVAKTTTQAQLHALLLETFENPKSLYAGLVDIPDMANCAIAAELSVQHQVALAQISKAAGNANFLKFSKEEGLSKYLS